MHPNCSLTLEAIRMVIEERLSDSAIEVACNSQSKENGKYRNMYNPTAQDCGFDLGDKSLSEAAKVLRLLHIKELRHLQTAINELIVAVQAVTANPKTDQSLGKVGK